jgi:hypothetical protein
MTQKGAQDDIVSSGGVKEIQSKVPLTSQVELVLDVILVHLAEIVVTR